MIPNIVMSVGSEEERKYVYKNMGERGEGEENKIWIEGINEVKNYGEDENSVGKYSDNKVGTIIGYGREVGEGKYVGMYMKGSKHEIKQGAGNSGEVVNVGLGISGKYENKVEIKWLTYVGMNKCRTEIGWEEGNVKGEFSMGEVGIDVEGGLKIRSELIGIVKPYIGIGARKSSYDKVEEKGKIVDVKIEGGSYERCVGRIGVEGIREISKRVEIVGRVEYERVIKGEVAGVKVEGVSGKVLGVREGKERIR
ncbi:autotransporter domain-containing protein [Candidatus Endomicrobiellum devescovinae]|uniref:autotransporter domain-containing protein n=1 Tax=Candidatus Endomicrobiellum devescovinae TaxID=3242322 RepID=UPI0028391415|nr:autotransporter outer membrane beta-barrel domain-containing protein [Endomicrobium sp.]